MVKIDKKKEFYRKIVALLISGLILGATMPSGGMIAAEEQPRDEYDQYEDYLIANNEMIVDKLKEMVDEYKCQERANELSDWSEKEYEKERDKLPDNLFDILKEVAKGLVEGVALDSLLDDASKIVSVLELVFTFETAATLGTDYKESLSAYKNRENNLTKISEEYDKSIKLLASGEDGSELISSLNDMELNAIEYRWIAENYHSCSKDEKFKLLYQIKYNSLWVEKWKIEEMNTGTWWASNINRVTLQRMFVVIGNHASIPVVTDKELTKALCAVYAYPPTVAALAALDDLENDYKTFEEYPTPENYRKMILCQISVFDHLRMAYLWKQCAYKAVDDKESFTAAEKNADVMKDISENLISKYLLLSGAIANGVDDPLSDKSEITKYINSLISWWNENKDETFIAAREFIKEIFKLIDELISEYEKAK